MKGVNAIENTNDPGKDGIVPSVGINPNLVFAKDLAAFSLEYFNSDYQAINSATPFASVNTSSHPATNSSELFNGNIRYMQTRLTNPTTLADMPMLNAYKYDQLNRLKESRSYETGLTSNVWNPTTYGDSYYNAFEYDAMGNILSQVRHNRAGTKIEDMKYKYQYLDPTTKTKLQRNRLYHIYEPLSLSSLDATDIDNMGAYDSTAVNISTVNNYVYDEEGRLVKDKAEKINKIVWRVDGKVKEIQRMTGSTKWLKFDYDAMGNRIAKHVYNNTGTTHERSTYYILDAQGNQISTYDHEIVGGSAKFHLKERNIFGSSRIGSKQDSINILTATLTQNYAQVLGTKYYEFSNHLGNVLTVFSDVKIALDEDADYVVDGFRVPIRNIADYSPFGVQLDGRTISMDNYRYGFQNQEKDDEIKGAGNSVNYTYRMHDPRVGRFFAVDPLASKYPWNSPYAFSENRVLDAIELEGLEALLISIKSLGNNLYQIHITPDFEVMDNATCKFQSTVMFNGNKIHVFKGSFGPMDQFYSDPKVDENGQFSFFDNQINERRFMSSEGMSNEYEINGIIPEKQDEIGNKSFAHNLFLRTNVEGILKFKIEMEDSYAKNKEESPIPKGGELLKIPDEAKVGSAFLTIELNDLYIFNKTLISIISPDDQFINRESIDGLQSNNWNKKVIDLIPGEKLSFFTERSSGNDEYELKITVEYEIDDNE